MNVNDNHFYCIRPAEFNCLHFFPHFFKVFKNNITIESAEIIESLEEALFYCKRCLKENIPKFVFSDSLSDVDFLEFKKIIQYYPLTNDSLVIVSIRGYDQ